MFKNEISKLKCEKLDLARQNVVSGIQFIDTNEYRLDLCFQCVDHWKVKILQFKAFYVERKYKDFNTRKS